jgi:2-polyprenyl-3-methyl-5-hydroxy-6-metoxy-1,4-benzoquinol methylase
MNPEAMEPFALALLDYFRGNESAAFVVRRDDGIETTLPAGHLFQAAEDFSDVDNTALGLCNGRVLDVGAGAGRHSLALQSKGFSVTALDVSPHLVEVMAQRGVEDVRCGDIFVFGDGPFDTLLMMGHGIGVVETIAGLDRFLEHAKSLLAADGQILLDSVDVRKTDEPRHLAYHEANRQAGRYIGEIRVQIEHQGKVGPTCGWLHIDPEKLEEHAKRAGWQFELIRAEPTGEYLARLTKQ